jgi:hypothetical protein
LSQRSGKPEVFDWWRKFSGTKTELGGAPRLGRQKTYSAESGYVYQYVLASFRQHRHAGEGVHDYSFEVSGGRGAPTAVSILLRASVLHQWETEHGRELTASERYAIAKVTLKRQLDASETPQSVPPRVAPDVSDVDDISSLLGF